MNDSIKYNIPEETPGMASESMGVPTTRGDMPQTYSLHTNEVENSCDNMEIEPLKYSLEELNSRISDGIEQYHQGIYYTQEEAHAILDKWICKA